MIADHHATGENELSVKAGDIVRVIKKDEETGTNSQEPYGAHKLLPREPCGAHELLPREPYGAHELLPREPCGAHKLLPREPCGAHELLPREPCGAHKLLPRDSVYGTACIMLCAAIYTTLHHFPSISLDEYQSITGHNVQIIVCTKLASHYITFQVFHWMNTRV